MGIFATRLRENRPIGESWVTALDDYFLGAGAYGVYDEKVLQEATLYGLPFWRISGGTTPASRRRRRRRPTRSAGCRWRR